MNAIARLAAPTCAGLKKDFGIATLILKALKKLAESHTSTSVRKACRGEHTAKDTRDRAN